MDAPKCKFCGKVEWRHICAGIAKALPVRKVVEEVREVPKVSHKEYMRGYMRQWRKKRALLVKTAQAVFEGRACQWPRFVSDMEKA